eukprot:GHVU01119460.1.p1 GENE.GHVU01119460.1~~GHVU01119460.1.p1  ORF type:complete len:179 (+),score=21.56 GHVU01119460.1:718-1254(+)
MAGCGDSQVSKKLRAPACSWSQAETDLVTREYGERLESFRDQSNKPEITKIRTDAGLEILAALNATHTHTPFTLHQLQNKIKSIRSSLKSTIATHATAVNRTGGGTTTPPVFSPAQELIASLVVGTPGFEGERNAVETQVRTPAPVCSNTSFPSSPPSLLLPSALGTTFCRDAAAAAE